MLVIVNIIYSILLIEVDKKKVCLCVLIVKVLKAFFENIFSTFR